MEEQVFDPQELLGALNPVEQKFAPKKLYVVGNTSFFSEGFRISIVGSRNASAEGIRRAKKLAKLASKNGGVVVSGLALGIDTAAHTGAIESDGRTIAVIGTPLDREYPKENADLQRFIMQKHLCISQFPPDHPVQPRNFPIRNRTMALISDATVIIEAGEKSGSINQGWEALRLGRGLFISNSLIERDDLTWTKQMMNYGASVLSDDLLEEFFESLPYRHQSLAVDAIPA